jgi:hypothetical protein
LINDDLDLFLQTITDDEVLSNVNADLSDEDKFLEVYRREVMKTAIDGRYSGLYLHVLKIVNVILQTSWFPTNSTHRAVFY